VNAVEHRQKAGPSTPLGMTEHKAGGLDYRDHFTLEGGPSKLRLGGDFLGCAHPYGGEDGRLLAATCRPLRLISAALVSPVAQAGPSGAKARCP